MKQLLFVCASHEIPKGAFSFLRSMQGNEAVYVTGLFFSPVDYSALATASQIPVPGPYLRIKEKEKRVVEENKVSFSRQCEQFHIKFQVHPNEDKWDKNVLSKESRFADLVVLSGQLFCSDVDDDQPNSILQEALHAAECPVIVVPEGFIPIERLVIAYDGSKESLYAMKQFCYLMPEYTDLPTEIIYVKEEGGQEIPDLDKLRDFSRLHFNSIGFSKLHFEAANYFATWIGEKKQVLMVSGSFGRSAFSYATRGSFAEQVIHDHKMPVFIAHT